MCTAEIFVDCRHVEALLSRRRAGFVLPSSLKFFTLFLLLLKKHQKNKLREKIFNILSLLSQNLLKNKDLFYDAEEIWDELNARGFSEEEIEMALSHIEKLLLELPGPYWSDQLPVHRSYTGDEIVKISRKVRGYLWKLKCRGVIDHALEDEIVHRAMNLELSPGIKEIKTVAALTIFGYEHNFQGGRVAKARELSSDAAYLN